MTWLQLTLCFGAQSKCMFWPFKKEKKMNESQGQKALTSEVIWLSPSGHVTILGISAWLYVMLLQGAFLFKAWSHGCLASPISSLLFFCLTQLISCNPLSVISEKQERNTTTPCHITPLQKLSRLAAGMLMCQTKDYGRAICLGWVWRNVSYKHWNQSLGWLSVAVRGG